MNPKLQRCANPETESKPTFFFSSKRLIISGCYPTCGVPYLDLDHIIASAFSDNAVRCFYFNEAWGRGSEVPADGDTLVIQFWFQRTHQAYRGLWLVLDWTKNTIFAWASNHDSPCILAWFHPIVFAPFRSQGPPGREPRGVAWPVSWAGQRRHSCHSAWDRHLWTICSWYSPEHLVLNLRFHCQS